MNGILVLMLRVQKREILSKIWMYLSRKLKNNTKMMTGDGMINWKFENSGGEFCCFFLLLFQLRYRALIQENREHFCQNFIYSPKFTSHLL